jgi:hypothetical protein
MRCAEYVSLTGEISNFVTFCYVVLFAKYSSDTQVKEDEMGRAYVTYGREEECIKGCGGKVRRKEATGKTYTQVGG